MASAPGVATHPLPTGQRLIVTVGVMMAVLLQVLDTTIANVALPHMQASLSATQDSINWVLTSYIVASAIALPISGWLADKVGRKRLLLVSVALFTGASVLCATATSLGEMVAFRALQGVGGAFIVPLAQATLFDINPREKHGQAMALFGGGVMIGPILGPVLGGWLTDNYNWRWVFLVNLPVGIICLLLMLRFMPKTETHERKFDMFGFSVLQSGFLTAPRGVGTLISMLLAGKLTGKIDSRLLVGIGVVLMGVSLYMMTGFAIDQPSRPVVMSGIVQGLGLGLIFVPLQSLAFETLAPRMRTTAAALLNLSRNIGGSIGISVVSTQLVRMTQVAHADLAQHITQQTIPTANSTLIQTAIPTAGPLVLAYINGEITRQALFIAYLA